jgi:hypothetical protein
MAMLAVSLLPTEALLTQAEAALVEPMLPRNRRPTSGLLSRKGAKRSCSAVARAIIDFPRVGRLSPMPKAKEAEGHRVREAYGSNYGPIGDS